MPSYKLTYFGVPGRAEICRLLFHYGGIDFEDNRISFKDWSSLKKDTPFGHIPILEIDGEKHAESLSIARYIANEVQIAGNNSLEKMKIDSIVSALEDFSTKVAQAAHREKDEVKKKELLGDLLDKKVPYFLEKLNSMAEKNHGYLTLGRLTWVDIFLVTVMENAINFLKQDIFANYSNLQQVKKNVLSIPEIRRYIANRPPNPMGGFYDLKQDL